MVSLVGAGAPYRTRSYEIDRQVTPRRLLQKMVLGDETLATVRIIEGWNFSQVRAALAAADALKPTMAALSDAEVMALLGQAGL